MIEEVYSVLIYIGIIGLFYLLVLLDCFIGFILSQDCPPWVDMESAGIKSGLPLNLFIFIRTERTFKKKKVSNPIVINVIAVWYHVKKNVGAFYPL